MKVSTKQCRWPGCVYWPGMEADVTDYIKRCLMCIDSSNLPVETLHPHEVPPGPWVKVEMDFFQDNFGKKHLIIADYFKFPYVYPVASSHHFKTINHLRELFTTEGIPVNPTMALHLMEMTSKSSPENLILFMLLHHLISTS